MISTRGLAGNKYKRHLNSFPPLQFSGYQRQLLPLHMKSFCDIINMLPLPLERDAADIRLLVPDRPESTICPGLQLPGCTAGDAPNPIAVALKFELQQVAVVAAAIFLWTQVFCIIKRLSNLARHICPNLGSACHCPWVCENGSSVSEPRKHKPGAC